MSSMTSPTVQITLSGIGLTDFTKSDIGKGYVSRTSGDGLHALEHIQTTTKKGRRRALVRCVVSDPASDPVQQATCTLTVDFPAGDNALGEIPAKAIVDFLAANTWEEVGLLVAGHNLG